MQSDERQITSHHDGHGLNDSITVIADRQTNGGASHRYVAIMPASQTDPGVPTPLHIQFQQGARNEPGSIPGVTEAVLLAILIDRLQGFQAGPFACTENDEQLVHLESALSATRRRADERAKRGVLGKEQK